MPVDPKPIQYGWFPRNEHLFKKEFIRIGSALVIYELEDGTIVQADDWPHEELTLSSPLKLNLESGLATRARAPKGAKNLWVFAAEKRGRKA